MVCLSIETSEKVGSVSVGRFCFVLFFVVFYCYLLSYLNYLPMSLSFPRLSKHPNTWVQVVFPRILMNIL